MADETGSTDALRSARDLLLRLRADYDEALQTFRWPDVGDRFNWAHDWFDTFGRGTAPRPGCSSSRRTARGPSTLRRARRGGPTSSRPAAHEGLGRGDRVIVMLGNQVELWESMLAIIKIGAVVMPATTPLGPADLADRIERGGARACDRARRRHRPSSTACRATTRGSRSASAPEGWLRLLRRRLGRPGRTPRTARPARRHAAAVLHVGHDRRPKLVEHTHVSYPVGPPLDDVLARPESPATST